MVTVLRPAHKRIEFFAAVATTHHDGLTPCLAYGVEELVYEYVQQVVCTLVRHGLLPALEQVGYTRTSRRLTRRQVQLIFEYLGEP